MREDEDRCSKIWRMLIFLDNEIPRIDPFNVFTRSKLIDYQILRYELGEEFRSLAIKIHKEK